MLEVMNFLSVYQSGEVFSVSAVNDSHATICSKNCTISREQGARGHQYSDSGDPQISLY